MEPGIDIDQDMLVQVLQSKIAEAALRDAQMEAAVQSLMMENSALTARLEALSADVEVVED